jgi:hypothetical protein
VGLGTILRACRWQIYPATTEILAKEQNMDMPRSLQKFENMDMDPFLLRTARNPNRTPVLKRVWVPHRTGAVPLKH